MSGGTHDQVWQGSYGDFRGVRPHGNQSQRGPTQAVMARPNETVLTNQGFVDRFDSPYRHGHSSYCAGQLRHQYLNGCEPPSGDASTDAATDLICRPPAEHLRRQRVRYQGLASVLAGPVITTQTAVAARPVRAGALSCSGMGEGSIADTVGVYRHRAGRAAGDLGRNRRQLGVSGGWFLPGSRSWAIASDVMPWWSYSRRRSLSCLWYSAWYRSGSRVAISR